MNLPVVYQPSAVPDADDTMRLMLLAMDVSRKAKKPGLADIDEYWDFCRAADDGPARPSST
ncbi:hypothetical protein [Sphingopyxis sp. 550A]|jgi:hypothetical protein